ncbi:hypothetical protein DFH08DRAFT_813821 [Mycena albidolilacea]|uniref:Uncharacterized protein n=1 Tax=Mycena albidolilacea TaxID=1033008 RepID=A0AAD6ZQV0_9AGAR|nr:hypothetical protein DFH08DRAFT_813821 [Mycena albidolilacea]
MPSLKLAVTRNLSLLPYMLPLPNFWLLVLTATCNAVQFNQVPLSVPDDWNLNASPSPNATGHLVFDTVNSCNTGRTPNTTAVCHTIVPGTIPTGTLLYHGRNDPEVPTTREWVATDSEFARLFCIEPESCWFLTLVTTRPLRVLYFDGGSATKMPDGPMDVQDLLIWGAVHPERANLDWEYERLNRLSELVSEIMLCNFTDGVEVQTFVRLEDEELSDHYAYAFIHSSAWYDHYPGDSRFHLDLSHAISLYDTALAPSLVSSRYGKPRRDHRVLGIDERDTRALLARVQALPSGSSSSNSGIDWRAMFHSIRDRYATRLEVLQSVLAEDAPPESAFVLLQTLLAPYRLHSAVARSNSSDTAWAAPVFRMCATADTLFADSEPVQATLTASERLLLAAARETSREICRTLVGMWAAGVCDSASLSSGSRLTRRWRAAVDRLMDWLGWAAWNTCRPACVFPESCYFPGVPFSMEEWNNSTPRCVRLFQPYHGIFPRHVTLYLIIEAR